ncbi:hypothetical protein L1987_02082 [Smallanthus sonchifolius]|uniref:Uncharacterized protein n=1 Tax=Smallanthus sonchifolius TaxID=185202 RepID=A0ACB9K6Z6_9ASTR|nr:hypothetical protein L1987_02082 [Smallanthus sonchifolius]
MKSGTTWLKALMFSTINRHCDTFSDHYLHLHTPKTAFPFLDIMCLPVTEFTQNHRSKNHSYVQKITARKDIDVMEDLDNGKPP